MAEAQTPRKHWLDRNIFGMGLASLFGDFCYEMSNAVLPMFLATIGAGAACGFCVPCGPDAGQPAGSPLALKVTHE